MPQPIFITLVDDHTIVRNGLKTLIESMGEYVVNNEFDDGQALVNNISLLKEPDLLIMDVAMPRMDGKQTMKWLVENNISFPVLILTLDTAEKTIIELFKLGVRGYIPKTCTAAELKSAIEEILKSGYYHNDLLHNALQYKNTETDEDRRAKILSKMTEREREFLELVCDEKEYTYEQIADIMKIHRRTVDGYREGLFEKFNIKSKTGLVLFVLKYNLLKTMSK